MEGLADVGAPEGERLGVREGRLDVGVLEGILVGELDGWWVGLGATGRQLTNELDKKRTHRGRGERVGWSVLPSVG